MVSLSWKVQAYVVIKNSSLHEENECDFSIWNRTVALYGELTLQSIKVNLFCVAVQLNPKCLHLMETDYQKGDIIRWNKACNWPCQELFTGIDRFTCRTMSSLQTNTPAEFWAAGQSLRTTGARSRSRFKTTLSYLLTAENPKTGGTNKDGN